MAVGDHTLDRPAVCRSRNQPDVGFNLGQPDKGLGPGWGGIDKAPAEVSGSILDGVHVLLVRGVDGLAHRPAIKNCTDGETLCHV